MPVATYDLFGQPAGFSSLFADSPDYTMGVQWEVTLAGGQTAVLAGIRWYSPAGAAVLPDHIALYAVTGRSLVTSQAASWSGAAGSGWVTALFGSPPALASATFYKGAILKGNGGVGNFYGAIGAYWSSGPGSGGITSGPLFAPNNASSDGGQDTFNPGGTLTYPATSFNASNYGVDVVVQVTTPAPPAVAAARQLAEGGRSPVKKLMLAGAI